MVKPALTKIARDPRESDKQHLLNLQTAGHLSTAQLRACSARYEEVLAEGKVKDPLGKVLREFDQGAIKQAERASITKRFPTLDEAPTRESKKQVLVWLHQHGSLAVKEMRQAAKVLNEDPDADLADVLWSVGARRALSDEFVAAREKAELDEAAKKATEPEGIQALNVGEAKELVTGIESAEELEALHALERDHPDHEGGRKGVLNAIEERLGELGVDDPNRGLERLPPTDGNGNGADEGEGEE